MLIEHLLYNFAIAILVGIIYKQYTKRNPAWIIFFAGCLPDIDYFFQVGTYIIYHAIEPALFVYGIVLPVIRHGDFHNIFIIISFSLIIGYLFRRWGFKFWDAVICTSIGMSAHIIEDLLVYDNPYHPFLPFSEAPINAINILNESGNMFGIGDWKIFVIGCIFIFLAYSVKVIYDGKDIFDHYISQMKAIQIICKSIIFNVLTDE